MKKQILIILICIIPIFIVIFSVVSSIYYTNKVTEIIESASYSYGKDYNKYSDYISEKDYKEFCMLSEGQPKEHFLCKGAVIVLPHFYFCDTRQEFSLYSKSETMDYWICMMYTFDIEFNWFGFQIKNIECVGAGDGLTSYEVFD